MSFHIVVVSKKIVGTGSGRNDLRDDVLKARLTAIKVQADLSGGTITMFCDDDIGEALAFGFWIVHFVTVNEHHNISILLNAAAIMSNNPTSQKVGAFWDGNIKHFSISCWRNTAYWFP